VKECFYVLLKTTSSVTTASILYSQPRSMTFISWTRDQFHNTANNSTLSVLGRLRVKLVLGKLYGC
jgi:hypothetical protein